MAIFSIFNLGNNENGARPYLFINEGKKMVLTNDPGAIFKQASRLDIKLRGL